jgi:Iap family predicted aminopeptidase
LTELLKAQYTGNGDVSAYFSCEMGNNYSTSYSYIENDKNDKMKNSLTFLDGENRSSDPNPKYDDDPFTKLQQNRENDLKKILGLENNKRQFIR